MFDFHFVYSDGLVYDVKDVTKIMIKGHTETREIANDDILTSKIPLSSSYYLYTPNGNITVSGSELKIIDIMKQND